MENFLPQASTVLSRFLEPLGFSFSPSFLQAAIIVVLVFLLAITLGFARQHMLTWSFKGAHFGFLFGIIFILILEAIFLVGGRTALFEASSNQRIPPNLRSFVEQGRKNLVGVLGLSVEQIPPTVAQEEPSAQSIIEGFQTLSPDQAQTVRSAICQP